MADDVWTVGRILAWIEGYLGEHGDESPRTSAQWLVAEALGTTRIGLYTDLERPLSASERDVLRGWTRRRAAGEPLQYLTGSTDFRFITLAVEPGVLIPRPETEVLVSEALARMSARALVAPRFADLCTGSGCIACSLAHEWPGARVAATDVAPEAVALAQRNVAQLGLGSQVQVVRCDLADGVPESWDGRCDLVISNPPYVPTDVLSQLPREVGEFEPALALDGGADGLDLFRRILPAALRLLAPGGVLACELHETCLDAAAALASAAGFADVRCARDLAGRPRVLTALRP